MNIWTTTRRVLLFLAFWGAGHGAFAQVTLPLVEDFESATAGTYTASNNPIPGLTGSGYHWRFEAVLPTFSRLRTNANIAYNSGTRAMTLDNAAFTLAQNNLILTANMAPYALAEDLELSFYYMSHGDEVHNGDSLWIRGDSTQPWIGIYKLIRAFGDPVAGVWNNVTLDLDALLAANGQVPTASLQVRFGNQDDGSATSPTVTDGVTIDDVSITGTLPVPNNAGVIALVQPANPYSGTGLQQVSVRIKNYGTNNLNTVRVDWEYNGVPQPFVVYPGLPLPPGGEANMVMGNVNMTAGNNYDFRFWTELPNGTADQDPSNDTLDATACRALAGTYTVGTPTSDFATVADMLTALYNCTINGPVTFEFAPGVYNGNITLGPIPGASAINTVTFDGLDTTAVTLQHDGTGMNRKAVVLLDSVKHVTFRNFRIVNTGTNNVYGVHFTNQADSNTVENCRIAMHYVANVVDVVGVLMSGGYSNILTEGNNANYNLIQNNIITGGEDAVHLEGEELANNFGNRILNNLIAGADFTGIYVDDQDGIDISGNVIRDIRNATSGEGIYALDLMNFRIVGNNVQAPDYCIYISDGNFDGAHSVRGLIANNMLNSPSDAAFYFDDLEDTDIWHNTARGVRGLYTNDPVALNIQNNIFVGTTNYAFESADAVAMDAMNYNLFHRTTAGVLMKYGTPTYNTLALWQAASFAYDANSRSGNPGFVSTTNLHILGTLPNDAGLAVGIVDDIDGDMRPMGVSVDMGADEYTPYTQDALAIQLLNPTNNICGDSNQVVNVIISNIGTAAITNMDVTANITGAITTSLTGSYVGNIPSGTSDTVFLGTINTFNGGFFTFQIFPQLSGEQNPSNDTMVVTIGISPSSPLQAINDSVCVGLPAVLATQPTPGVTLQWFNVPSGGTPVSIGNTYSYPALTTSDTMYVQPLSQVPGSLQSTFAGGNGQNGSMFDITALSNITITGFTGRATTTGTYNYRIYYKTGTCVGFATNAAAWTLIAQGAAPVTAAGSFSITTSLSVPIAAGQTGAFYITNTGSGPTTVYTTTGTLGGVLTSNADLQFKTGYGNPYPFGAPFSPRAWNGIVHYNVGGGACNTDRVAVQAVAMNPQTLNLGADTTICSNSSLVLNTQIPNGDYVWSTNAATPQITVNTAGSYNVRVEDAYGCDYVDTILVSNFPAPTIVPSVTNPSCTGDADGAVTLGVSGGVGLLAYEWSTGDLFQNISGLSGGVYDVTVTDGGSSCVYTTSATLIDPTPIAATAAGVDAFCMGSASGSATVTATGGTGAYTYDWSDGQTTATANNLMAGSYTVTVTDANGCSTTASQSITAPAAVSIALDSIQDETMGIDGGVYISVSGGTAPYSVLWSTGATTEDLTGVIAASYTVVVVDMNGCSDTLTSTVNYAVPMSQTALEAGVEMMRLFPNPTQDVAYLQLELNAAKEVRVELMDIAGKSLQVLAPQTDMNQQYVLDLSNYAGGVYTVRILVDNAVITQKLILTR